MSDIHEILRGDSSPGNIVPEGDAINKYRHFLKFTSPDLTDEQITARVEGFIDELQARNQVAQALYHLLVATTFTDRGAPSFTPPDRPADTSPEFEVIPFLLSELKKS